MTRAEIEATIRAQFSGRTDKDTQLPFFINNALNEIGQRHAWQALKDIETDIDLLSLALTVTAGAWDYSALSLTQTAKFAAYTYASGDMIYITGGTDVVVGWYSIASKTSDNEIVLSSAPVATNQTNITATWIGTPQWVVLPTATSKVHGAILIDGSFSYPIDIRTKDYVDSVYPEPASALTSGPWLAYRLGSKLRLAPYITTDSSVRLTTTVKPTLAAGSTAEPTLEGVDNTLIARVLMDLYGGAEFPAAATYWERRYERMLALLIQNDINKPGTVIRGHVHRPTMEPNAVTNINDVRF